MKRILFSLLLLVMPLAVQAQIVVVVGERSPITSLSETEVRQLFSGQLRAISGQRLQPVDLPATDDTREQFYRKLMGRSPEQMRAYWTRLIFTGQAQPPREVTSVRELGNLLASANEFVGYAGADNLPANTRIVYRAP